MPIGQQLLTNAIDALTVCATLAPPALTPASLRGAGQKSRRCLRLNLDCADLCRLAAGVLVRQTEPDFDVVRAAVESCVQVCRSCRDECERHG